MSELSGIELREAVATEVMGWRYHDASTLTRPLFVRDDMQGETRSLYGSGIILGIPAYESDIAAAQTMEDRLQKLGLADQYATILLEMFSGNITYLVYASPAMRCRAALAATRAKKPATGEL